MSTNAPIFASGSGILLNHEAVYDGFIEQQSMESEEQDAPIFASGSGILLNHEAVYDDYIEQQAQQAHEEEEEQEEGDADEEIVQLDPRLINYEAVYDDFIEQQVQPTDYDASYDGLIDLLDQEDTTPADYKRIDYDAAYDDFIERQEQGAPIPAPKPAPRPSSLAAEATPVPAPKPAPRKRAKKEWVSAFITTVSGFETVALEEIVTKLGEDVQKLKGDIFDGKIYMQIRPSRVPDVRRNFFLNFILCFINSCSCWEQHTTFFCSSTPKRSRARISPTSSPSSKSTRQRSTSSSTSRSSRRRCHPRSGKSSSCLRTITALPRLASSASDSICANLECTSFHPKR